MRNAALAVLTLVFALLFAPLAQAQATPPEPAQAAAGVTAAGGPSAPVPVPEPSEKALRYYRSGNVLWAIATLWGLLVPLLLLFTGLSARMRDAGPRDRPQLVLHRRHLRHSLHPDPAFLSTCRSTTTRASSASTPTACRTRPRPSGGATRSPGWPSAAWPSPCCSGSPTCCCARAPGAGGSTRASPPSPCCSSCCSSRRSGSSRCSTSSAR